MDRSLQPEPEMAGARAPTVRRSILWALAAALAIVGVLQVGLAWGEIVSSGMDIQQDYVAGQRLLTGQDIYAPIRPAEVSALGVHEEYGVGMRLNVHPPLTALMFAPLTLLPFPLATLIWTIGCAALLLGLVHLLIGELDLPARGPWRAIVPLLVLNWYPVWQHLHVGQFTIVLFGLIVGAWLCERRGHAWLAGCLLGIAAVMKIYPALLIGYALLRGRWRVVGGAAIIALALVAAQTAVSPQHWIDYLTRVAPSNAAEWMPNARNASLASISMRLFVGSGEVRPLFDMPWLELPTRAGLYALALAGCGTALWRLRGARDLVAEYALCLSAIALLSPLSWDHAYIFLLMPFALIWQQARARPGPWRRAPLALMGLALALSLFPAEIVFANLRRAYQLQQMPPLAHLHATGVAVLLCGFGATLAMILTRPLDASSVASSA